MSLVATKLEILSLVVNRQSSNIINYTDCFIHF